MSVFGTHTSPSYLRTLGILVAVGAVVVGTVHFGGILRGSLTASQLNAVRSPTPSDAAVETVFPSPRPIEVQGYIIGILAGGEGIAIRRNDNNQFMQAYFPEGQISSISDGPVLIRGQLTGISCAYALTLFGGLCTPTIDISAITAMPIVLQRWFLPLSRLFSCAGT